jgi:hypothetical protein
MTCQLFQIPEIETPAECEEIIALIKKLSIRNQSFIRIYLNLLGGENE